MNKDEFNDTNGRFLSDKFETAGSTDDERWNNLKKSAGLIEYIDTDEANTLMIALNQMI